MNDRPNIYARLQLPWVIVMWIFLAIGVWLLFQDAVTMKLYGFGVLALCMFMLIAWVTRINPRAARTTEKKKEQPKRKNKHPAYRQPKH